MRRTLGLLALLIGVAALVVACTGAPGNLGVIGGHGAGPAPVSVTTQPADGASGVNPAQPVTVTVAGGRLTQVSLTNPDGQPVAGTLAADGRSWTSSEPLGYGKTYTYAGSATGADGRQAPVKGSFGTLKPRKQVRAQLNIGDGDTVGIAAPIILQFDEHVSDKAAVERALSVQTSVPTVGSWAWLPDDNGGSRAHWRPKAYYQPGTQVTVTAKLYGVDFGDGSYGKEDLGSHFTIGRAQIVKADVTSHRMVVVRDGQTVMDIPASYGLGSDPNRVTRNGIHVVMRKDALYYMSNPAYGYENVPEHWSVRISNNGEFIHANPETTGVQGSANVTHGCVNLSTANAKAYYQTAIFGDPVEVTGSPIMLSGADGDVYDWAVPWDRWQAMSALT